MLPLPTTSLHVLLLSFWSDSNSLPLLLLFKFPVFEYFVHTLRFVSHDDWFVSEVKSVILIVDAIISEGVAVLNKIPQLIVLSGSITTDTPRFHYFSSKILLGNGRSLFSGSSDWCLFFLRHYEDIIGFDCF